MKNRTKFDYAIERAEVAAMDLELAAANYHIWMSEWRKRNGHAGKPYDTTMGFPLKMDGA